MFTEKRPCEDSEKAAIYQGERPQEKPNTLLTPWSWNLQNYEKINFYFLSHPVCGSLLWKPEQTNTTTHKINTIIITILERARCYETGLVQITELKYDSQLSDPRIETLQPCVQLLQFQAPLCMCIFITTVQASPQLNGLKQRRFFCWIISNLDRNLVGTALPCSTWCQLAGLHG